MLFATIGQGARLIWMLAAGAVIGAWYALTAGLRRILQAGFWLTLACDLLFGAGCAVILTAALVAGNYGRVRLFELIAAAAGVLLFHLGAGAGLKYAADSAAKSLRRIMTFLSENRLIKVIFK